MERHAGTAGCDRLLEAASRRDVFDCLKRMLADESHHRDVNHAMASMTSEQMFGAANPFIHEHKADYEEAVKRRTEAVLKKALGNLDLYTVRSAEVLASKK